MTYQNSIRKMYGKSFRKYKLNRVIEDIKRLNKYEIDYIFLQTIIYFWIQAGWRIRYIIFKLQAIFKLKREGYIQEIINKYKKLHKYYTDEASLK